MENEFIKRELEKYEITKPIYTDTLAKKYAAAFGVDLEEAKKIVKQDLEAEMGNKTFNLRKYRDGIYYLTEQTPLGELEIDTDTIKKDKYLSGFNGYRTGPDLLNRIGLCTMLPREEWYATNNIDKPEIHDKEFCCCLIRPKTRITKDNYRYLQILDAVEWKNEGFYDVPEPNEKLNNIINELCLDKKKLIKFADQYYDVNVRKEIRVILRGNNEL